MLARLLQQLLLGLRNSMNMMQQLNLQFIHIFSRPKRVDELAYQEEVVKTLKNSIQSGNVRFFYLMTYTLPSLLMKRPRTFAASSPTVFWAAWNWQNIRYPRTCKRDLWVCISVFLLLFSFGGRITRKHLSYAKED